MSGGLIAHVMMQSNSGRKETFADLIASAEQEPGAFVQAVSDSFGTAGCARGNRLA
jgi:hypothetical protein